MRRTRPVAYVKLTWYECFDCHAVMRAFRRLDVCPVCGDDDIRMMN